jgi:hypothetical protein
VRVTDQDGLEWEVWRQWLHVPRWRLGRPRLEDVLSTPMDDGDDWLAGIAIVVVVVVIVFLFFLVGLPLLLLVAGFLFAVGGLVLRIVFRRPWIVRARSEHGELEWRVRGALGSRRAIHEVALALERGDRRVVPRGGERVLPLGDDVRVLRGSG